MKFSDQQVLSFFDTVNQIDDVNNKSIAYFDLQLKEHDRDYFSNRCIMDDQWMLGTWVHHLTPTNFEYIINDLATYHSISFLNTYQSMKDSGLNFDSYVSGLTISISNDFPKYISQIIEFTGDDAESAIILLSLTA